MRDPQRKGNLAYEAGVSAADSMRDRLDDGIDLSDPLDVENLRDGFTDYVDELIEMDAEDRRNA